MAPLIYLDTHVVAWLYAGRLDLLPATVTGLLEHEDLRISPIVRLELQYLFEVEKTAEPAFNVVSALERQLGLEVCPKSFGTIVNRSLSETWTRDPFDRLIVSQAAVGGDRLLTKDRAIRDHYPEAVWD